jgi:hypothetical protein
MNPPSDEVDRQHERTGGFVTTGDLGGTRLHFEDDSYLLNRIDCVTQLPRRSSGYESGLRRDSVPRDRTDDFFESPRMAARIADQGGRYFESAPSELRSASNGHVPVTYYISVPAKNRPRTGQYDLPQLAKLDHSRHHCDSHES